MVYLSASFSRIFSRRRLCSSIRRLCSSMRLLCSICSTMKEPNFTFRLSIPTLIAEVSPLTSGRAEVLPLISLSISIPLSSFLLMSILSSVSSLKNSTGRRQSGGSSFLSTILNTIPLSFPLVRISSKKSLIMLLSPPQYTVYQSPESYILNFIRRCLTYKRCAAAFQHL